MDQPILEREHEIAEMAEAMNAAARGSGCVLLVFGEAGIGKSSLVEAARGLLPDAGRMLVGYCDDLATSRTLGPFRDLVGSVGPKLAAALAERGDRDRVFEALRDELDWPQRPTVLAIEDVHWADDASLDVLGYLVRRIDRLPAVLLLTYRDDEVIRGHPLRRLLGQLAGAGRVRRLPLSRLSEEAVRRLSAGRRVDAHRLHLKTSGNPFFVTEVLAAPPGQEVPRSVADAVLARFGRLDAGTQDAVEQLAVVPSTIERWLVDELVAGGLGALATAELRGLLEVTPAGVAFRHELTRRAIADSLAAARRVEFNRRVLAAMVGRDASDPSRIVHHAAEAGDDDATVRYGLQAGRDAGRSGAHRQAAAHFRLVLEQRERFPPAERADLLEQYASECSTIGDAPTAVLAQREAVALRRGLGDPRRLGAAIRALARMSWRNGDRVGSTRAAAEAVEVLREAGDPRLLARALAQQAAAHMVSDRNADCVRVGKRAIALADDIGDKVILADAMCSVGTSRWLLGDPEGRPMLEESLRVAESAGAVEATLRVYGNLVWELLDHFLLDDAARHLGAGLALAEQTEHMYYTTYLNLEQGRLDLFRGDWELAERAARAAMDSAPPDQCQALILLGRVLARRGQPGADEALAEAWELAVGLGELQHLAPAAAARAEAAWLRGDQAAARAAITPIYDDVCRLGIFAVQTELAFWLGKAGRAATPMLDSEPYGLLVAGRWREAADFWQAAGCPYEHALALTASPDPDDGLAALAELDVLGAAPLARAVRAGLRGMGLTAIPRGPVAATRENPAGLTTRQVEVLRLLTEGLTNAEIAARLVVSPRTVDSHIAAVLDKLGARNRRDAAARAAEIGVLEARGQQPGR